MLIQLLHLTSCTSSDMNSLYTTTNSLYFFQASVELYTRYTCRPTVKKNSNTVFRSFLKFNCHMTFTYMLQRCGQSKVCLFFPQSSPQLCGISFLFHSGLCTLPKKKKKSKSQTCIDLSIIFNLGEILDQKEKFLFSILSNLIWKAKQHVSWFLFFFLFFFNLIADIYLTSLKVNSTGISSSRRFFPSMLSAGTWVVVTWHQTKLTKHKKVKRSL